MKTKTNRQEIELKKCNSCKEVKTVDNFYWVRRRNNRFHICKVCATAKKRDEYPKARDSRKVKMREYSKEWVKRVGGKEYANGMAKKMMAKYPEKWKARSQLRNAVKLGNIQKQFCRVCGEIKVQGHHDDYSKPFDVIWLCQQHHTKKHDKFAT